MRSIERSVRSLPWSRVRDQVVSQVSIRVRNLAWSQTASEIVQHPPGLAKWRMQQIIMGGIQEGGADSCRW